MSDPEVKQGWRPVPALGLNGGDGAEPVNYRVTEGCKHCGRKVEIEVQPPLETGLPRWVPVEECRKKELFPTKGKAIEAAAKIVDGWVVEQEGEILRRRKMADYLERHLTVLKEHAAKLHESAKKETP